VLDEADQMLDMGFIQPIRASSRKLDASAQTLFFSATMPKEIGRWPPSCCAIPCKSSVTPAAPRSSASASTSTSSSAKPSARC
jgi:ATP-dependent RNA helicase RhlE